MRRYLIPNCWRAALIATAAAVLASCTDDLTRPSGTVPHASVAAAVTVPATVTWLAPLGTGTADPSTFDAAATPVVEVCAWTGSACTGALVARFSIAPGGDDGSLAVNATAGRYEASWNLNNSNFTARRTYRIRVLQGTTELSALSVDVVRGRWAFTRTDGTLAPLVSATTLPIAFGVSSAPTLTVVLGPGVSGTPNAGTTSHPAGTSVAYAFQALEGYENVTVLLDTADAPVNGTVTMDGSHVLFAAADSVVRVDAPAQQMVSLTTAVLAATTPAAAREAARAYMAAAEQLSATLGADGASRQLAAVDATTFDYSRDSLALRLFTHALAEEGLVRVGPIAPGGLRSAPAAQPYNSWPAVTSAAHAGAAALAAGRLPADIISINGILTGPSSATRFASTTCQVATEAGLFAAGQTDACYRITNDSWTLQTGLTSAIVQCIQSAVASVVSRSPIGNVQAVQSCNGPREVLSQYAYASALVPAAQPPTGTVADVEAILLEQVGKGHKVLVVAHSQGNLLMQLALNHIEQTRPEALKCIAVVELAPPVVDGWPAGVAHDALFAKGLSTGDILLNLPTASGGARLRTTFTDRADIIAPAVSLFTTLLSTNPRTARFASAFDGVYKLGSAIGAHGVQGYLENSQTRGWISERLAKFSQALDASCGVQPEQPDGPDRTAGNVGYSFGDPHLQTVDGGRYSFQGAGDYRFSKSTVADDDFEVQTRFRPLGTTVSVNDGAAARVVGDVVNVFAVSGRFDLIINDETITATTSFARELPGGGTVSVSGGQATVSWPDRTLLTVQRNGGVVLLLSSTRLAKVEGLLGNYDGNTTDDLKIRNGAPLDTAVSGLYGAFRESWYVPYGTPASLFRRPPAVPVPASFPSAVVTLADFSAATVNAARAACRAAGVVHPDVLNECAFDIAVTGDNGWAAVAVQFDPMLPKLTASPALAYLAPGENQAFTAAATGLTNRAVVWTATGGSIATTGPNGMTYTAPATLGEYTITARSAENGTITSTATVTVRSASGTGGSLTNGATSTGRIASAGQVDTWTIPARAGDYLFVSMGEAGATSGSFYPRLRLIDPTGKEVSYNNGGSRAQVGVARAIAGVYTLRVDSYYAATGDYRLTLAQVPGTPIVSPGDQGGPLTNGATHTGSIYLGDVDVWTVTATAGDYLLVSMGEASEAGGLYPQMRLIDPTGEEVSYNDGGTRAQVGVGRAIAGVYTVLVDTYYAGTGDYRLTLVQAPDTPETSLGDQGGPLTNGAIHSGSIYVGDVDAWTITARAGDYLLVSMGETGTTTSDFYPRMRLIDPAGRQVSYSDGGSRAQVGVANAVAGPYTVVVDSYYPGTGDYRLTVVDAPGTLTVSGGDQGGTLTNGLTHTGNIYLGDIDAWTITAAAGDYLLVSMGETEAAPGSFYPRMRLLDPNGKEVSYNDGGATAQVGTTGAVAGVYTVIVDSYYEASGDYRLSAMKVPGSLAVSAGDQGGTLVNGTTYEGTLYFGDVDGWTFTATAGSSATLRMAEVTTTAGSFYPRVRVIGPTGKQVGYGDGGAAVQVTINVAVGGVYTVLVDSYYAGAGTYTLTATGVTSGLRVGNPDASSLALQHCRQYQNDLSVAFGGYTVPWPACTALRSPMALRSGISPGPH